MRALVLPSLALLGCAPGPRIPDPIPRGDWSYALDYLDWRLGELVDDEEIPGLAVAVLDDQELVWLETWGVTSLDGGAPVTEDTVWRVGSLTKLVTAVEVLRLEEEGRLDLDAPVTDVLPEFSVRTRETDPDPVTPRALLAHRGGLPRNTGLPTWYWDLEVDVMQAQAEALGLWYAAHPVGERYHYSNAGFETLAAMVEVQREAPWVFWVQDETLAPLGMADSALLLQELPAGAEVAVGHTWEDGAQVTVHQGDLITLASGNLYASAPDLVELMRFFLREGEPLLGPEAVRSMYDVQYASPRDPRPMGLAWFTSDARLPELLLHHTGTNQGTETMLALLPESRLGVVVVGNSTRFAELYGAVVIEALELALETKTGDQPLEHEEPEWVHVAEEVLDAWAGRYVCGPELLQVYRKGGKLKVDYGGVSLRLRPVDEDRFRLHHWLGDPGDVEVRFSPGGEGEQDLMLVDIEDLEHMVCPRIQEVDEVPALWEEIAGTYTAFPRVESAWFEGEDLGTVDADLEDGILRLGSLVLQPLDASELLVIGGEWDGETVLRDPETGVLTFQHEVFEPR